MRPINKDYSTAKWFGEVLRAHRKLCGMNIKQAAKIAGVRDFTLKTMESSGVVPYKYIDIICDTYDIQRDIVEFVSYVYGTDHGLKKIAKLIRKKEFYESARRIATRAEPARLDI